MIARTTLGRTLAVVLSLALPQVSVPVAQAATPHLVDQSQVVARLLDGAKSREEKVKLFQAALATPEATRQAKSMGLSAGKLKAALPHLSDKELEDLSQRAARTKDVAAGYHGDDGLVILGIVLLLAGLAVLVAVGDYGNYYEEDCYCY